jgi:3-methyladenine DNA glycosylase/8-oxoguanine DNA glycosylase
MTPFAVLPLRGAGGEPVDLRRTLGSHGVAALPPARIAEDFASMTVTLAAPGGARTVLVAAEAEGAAEAGGPAAATSPPAVAVKAADAGPPPDAVVAAALKASVRHMLCLDDDLSGFYRRASADPELSWACAGAGRMLRSPTVFEDVIKTVCTTNCAWSATERMVGALVGRLGETAPGAADAATDAAGPTTDAADPAAETVGHAFPTSAAMAAAGEDFYRDVARAGYRGARLRAIAAAVAGGDLDLEALRAPRAELADDEVEERLLALPGVGPYAAAHVMMLLGRHSRLILDSWTRPKYARLVGKAPGKLAPDKTIGRRFRAYGADAGLAFWLFLTRDWIA